MPVSYRKCMVLDLKLVYTTMNIQSALFLLFAFGSALLVTTGIKIETLKKCCNLGTNYAESDLKCTSFQTPIAGISKEDESLCLNSIDVCCKKQYREKQCSLGQNDAITGKDCSSSVSQIEGVFRKDCCEACQLGLQTSESEQSCQLDLGLDALLDSVFKTCCKERIKFLLSTPSSSSTTATSATKYTSKPNIMENKSNSTQTPKLLCDIPDLCAHVCIPTDDSYKCVCHEGFTLMADGLSCRAIKQAASNTQQCTTNNPCDHECIDTGVAIKCSCYDGFELAADKRTCKDIDECGLELHDCALNEICINLEGDFDCQLKNIGFNEKCPEGYKFDGERMVCDDINECEITLVCPKPNTCVNTIGSFKCVEAETPQCPLGFYFKASIQTCEDIDECISDKNDCNQESQNCLNTKGNYTCIDKASKKTCPPGFKKNLTTQQCEDINECEENMELCGKNEECVNELGGHNCMPKSNAATGQKAVTASSSTTQAQLTKSILVSRPTKRTPTHKSPVTEPISKLTPTSTPSSTILSSVETSRNLFSTISLQTTPQSTPTTPKHRSTSNQRQENINTSKSINSLHHPQQLDFSCSKGFKFVEKVNGCMDIDECSDDSQVCDSNQDCYNTVGSYICNCKRGFTKDYQTGACVDINECQVGQHECTEGQRCDNTIGSYLCSRTTGCGTGYTLNSGTGLCEDDDECVLGSHNCHDLGPKFQCRNILGSYRCERIKCIGDCSVQQTVHSTTPKFIPPPSTEPTHSYPVIDQLKKCLPGYRMNIHGECEDINECESNPCQRSEKCINLNGRFHCIPLIICKSGYELNEAGTVCEDINECTRGTHRCKVSQICKNGPGYYICQCPPGHKLNQENECEDINECEFYRDRICSRNAYCINSVGSYICKCKDGFRENGYTCDDIDECGETTGLCHQNCINVWGSYRCSCNRGFTLSADNRTCTDINECDKFRDKNLCVGECQNTPGSYSCKCPDGYKLGTDGRTCQDIDECQRNACRNTDDICVNTRGGYKCHTIVCPPNYIRDPDHKSRCKRASNVCDIRDINCIRMPGQYSYHFVTFVSNLPIPAEGRIDFFQMKGPNWVSSTANFNMNILNVRCPRTIRKANEAFFRMKRDVNNIVVSLIQPIQGPQEIELQLQMELYITGVFQGMVVSTVFIYVSEYEF